MSIWSRIDASKSLSEGLANRLGVDLSSGAPEVVARRLRDVTLRCATCRDQATCAKLQAQTETMQEPPVFCRNTALFQSLKGE